MTTLQDKTPEELNVELSELLGFVRSTTHKFSLYGLCEIDQEATDPVPAFTKDGRWYRPNTLPPYATSYDAIMPEILRLEGRQREDFCKQLERIRMPQWRTANFGGCGVSWLIDWALITASPADLTRALILTLQSK